MQLVKRRTFSAIIAIFTLFGSLGLAEDGFILGDFSEAQRLAEKTKRPMLVIFGADYCVWCEKLKKQILMGGLPETDNYIICYIDIEKAPELQKKYQVRTIPDSRIIKGNKEVAKMTGFNLKEYREWAKVNDR